MQILFKVLIVILVLCSCTHKERPKVKIEKNKFHDIAYEYLYAKKNDSAFYYFDQAKELFLEMNDSSDVANCLINMANIQFDHGDFYGAQEMALSALNYLKGVNEKSNNLLSFAYNTIANASDELNQFEDAIRYYALAIQYCKEDNVKLKYKNNLSVSLRYAKKYKEAIQLSEDNLRNAPKNSKDYARILNNLARVKFAASVSYNPLGDYWIAMKIRKDKDDFWGLNSSYASLSQYYGEMHMDSALYYAEKQYTIAKQLKSPNDQINALKRLIEYNKNSQKQYFTKFLALNDSIQQARAAAKNQFALIRYEVEKNKADNLRLEKENAEKQNRLVRQRAITGASIFLLLLAVGGGTLWYKRRKQRLELEAENKVKETQLHLSKKVHDVVANDIYHVMTEVEYRDDLDREVLLDKLEIIYNQSRDISHNVEQRPTVEVPYNEQISTLLKPYGTSDRRISIVGIDAEQWVDVSKRIKEEIKHVLQELMVNMKKHSGAERVVVRIEKSDQELKIFYKDNGVGLPAERPQGKGMANTVSRIESLGGGIIFVSEPGEGLSITVNIPLI